MTRVLLAVFVVAAISGCPSESKPGDAGTSDGGAAGFVVVASGTRLRAVGLEGVVSRFFDSTLNLECSFARDSQFGYRCFPTAGANSNEFEDANCTQPINRQDSCSAAVDTLVSVYQPGGCTGLLSLKPYRVGGTVSLTEAYGFDGAGCSKHALGGTVQFQRLTAVDESMFQAATPKRFGTAPVGVEVLVTEDGAKALLGGYSFADEASCRVSELGSGTPTPAYCIAGDFAYDYGEFVERADCTKSVGYSVGTPQCGPARYVLSYRPEGTVMYSGSLRYAVGEVDAGAVDRGDVLKGICNGPVLLGNQRYWRPGEPAPLPAKLSTGTSGNGAVRPEVRLTPEGLPLEATGSWIIAATGERCTPNVTADAGTRCLPQAQAYLQFADSSCTMPIADSPDAGAYGFASGYVACAYVTLDAYTVGAVTTPAKVYDLNPIDGCREGQPLTGATYRVATQVPWSTFPELSVAH